MRRINLYLVVVLVVMAQTFGLFLYDASPVESWISEPEYGWTYTIGGESNDTGSRIIVDSCEDVYSFGYFQGTDVDMDGTPGVDLHSSNGGYDVYLSKYTSDGSYLWTYTLGGTSHDFSSDVAVDSEDNIYIFGGFQGMDVDMDGTPGVDLHSSNGGYDVFLSKYDRFGSYLWTYTVGGGESDTSSVLITDPEDNLIVTGGFRGTNIDLDGTAGTDLYSSTGSADIFLTKYNSEGEYVSTYTCGGSSYEGLRGLALDSENNLYVTGFFEGSNVDLDLTVGSDLYSSNGWYDFFVSKYGPDNSYAWTYTVGGGWDDYGQGIAVDSTDNIYIIGNFLPGTIDFDGTDGTDFQTVSGSAEDATISKYNADGSYAWTYVIGGDATDWVYDLYIDVYDNLYVAASFSGTDIDLDGTDGIDSHSSNGSSDVFLSKYKVDGSYAWAYSFGGSEGPDSARSIFIDQNLNIWASGSFNGVNVDFDGTFGVDLHSSNGGGDMFFSKYIQDVDAPGLSLSGLELDTTNSKTPTFRGTATDSDNRIALVEYQIDSRDGEWVACEAEDGAFDESVEDFVCTVGEDLSEGEHVIYIRAIDSNGNVTEYGSELAYEFIVEVLSETGAGVGWMIFGGILLSGFVVLGSVRNRRKLL